MLLTAGDRLGPYEILAPIGAGGMGEVYRAKDTKLDRDVAIKVLPAALAQDPERLARFEREAKVLASLNHPNIAAIYGVEERALVMELVPGESIKGPLPLETALNYAHQIADALEAAHEKNIIHRDLKPANIMVTPAGVIKVLDFGLAAVAQSSDASNPANSPTLTISPTRAGMILGTAAYMSPEQARGKPVDKRADIWAFGVVLFEMLTGQRLFDGETVSDTLAQVLTKEPDWEQVPGKVRRLLKKCLERDPKKRLRDIGDAWELLEDAPATTVSSPSRRATTGWVAAGALVVALGIALWAPWRGTKPADRPLVRLDVDLGADVSLPTPGLVSSVVISPDGTRLVYASGNPPKLFTRRLDQSKASELPGTEGATIPFFSPDGQWVGFNTRGKLNKISVEGGAVVPLADVSNFAGASWGEDGSIIMIDFIKGLQRIPAGGGPPEALAGLANGETSLAFPQILPGGKAILFGASIGAIDVDTNVIEVLTLADRRRKILAKGGGTPRYLATSGGLGHLVYVNRATLFAIPFDLNKLETRGTAVPILDDVAHDGGGGAGQFSISGAPAGHGTLIYRRAGGGASAMTTLQWIDASGKKEPLLAKPGAYASPSLSPDGKRLALTVTEGSSQDIWVYDPERDVMTRLTFGGAPYVYQSWSPDGQFVVFSTVDKGIFQARADGAGQPQALTESKATQIPWSFTPDGKRLAYFEGRPYQIWTVPLEEQGGQLKAGTPEQFLKSSFSDVVPTFSPDGRWLAYSSNKSGKYEVYVGAFPAPSSGQGGKWQISNNGGEVPRWSRNGHDLLYRSGDQIMAANYTVKGDAFVSEKPRVWIAKLGGMPSFARWDLSPDGKRALVVTPVESAEAPKQEHEVVFLENFFDELRRRVPAGK